MNPIRLLTYINSLCNSSLTMAQIKTRIADVKTSALVNPDIPDRGHDIAWYCDVITAAIVAMETAVPPWPAVEIKQQILGRLTGLIPLA